MRFLLRVAGAFLFVFAAAGTAKAQGDDGGNGVCGQWIDCSIGGHWVLFDKTGVQNTHYICMICTSGFCHPGCEVTLVPETRNAYRAVLAAAAKFDVQSVARLASKVGAYVVFNEERNSIQVFSCSKETVVANLPVSTPKEMRAVASLRVVHSRVGTLADIEIDRR